MHFSLNLSTEFLPRKHLTRFCPAEEYRFTSPTRYRDASPCVLPSALRQGSARIVSGSRCSAKDQDLPFRRFPALRVHAPVDTAADWPRASTGQFPSHSVSAHSAGAPVARRSHRCVGANLRCSFAYTSRRSVAAAHSFARRLLQRMYELTAPSARGFGRAGPLDFRDQRGTHYGGIGQSPEYGNMTGERNAEANRKRQRSHPTGPPNQFRQIIRQCFFRAGYAGTRNQIQESAGDRRDFREAVIGGSRRSQKNCVESLGGTCVSILASFLGRQVGDQDAVRTRRCGAFRKVA